METSYKFRDGRVLVTQYNDGIQIDEWHTDSYKLKEGESWKTNENGEHYVINGNGDVTVGMGGKIKNVGHKISWEEDDGDSYGKATIGGNEWNFTIERDPVNGDYSIYADTKINGKRKVVSGKYRYADKKAAMKGINELVAKIQPPEQSSVSAKERLETAKENLTKTMQKYYKTKSEKDHKAWTDASNEWRAAKEAYNKETDSKIQSIAGNSVNSKDQITQMLNTASTESGGVQIGNGVYWHQNGKWYSKGYYSPTEYTPEKMAQLVYEAGLRGLPVKISTDTKPDAWGHASEIHSNSLKMDIKPTVEDMLNAVDTDNSNKDIYFTKGTEIIQGDKTYTKGDKGWTCNGTSVQPKDAMNAVVRRYQKDTQIKQGGQTLLDTTVKIKQVSGTPRKDYKATKGYIKKVGLDKFCQETIKAMNQAAQTEYDKDKNHPNIGKGIAAIFAVNAADDVRKKAVELLSDKERDRYNRWWEANNGLIKGFIQQANNDDRAMKWQSEHLGGFKEWHF